ncbi:polysaccharide pyruvyl transferase family protein [Nocardioides dongkuii]|uniref:polysaccharide pyruvyl transferase family protein n=1 Tax=Nocardioides dongkuii TaxID=2760089 RepID=UPI0015F80BFB|nr:polysaccharide pyruvyl transferase family protein [Nocardioides dongkuii]
MLQAYATRLLLEQAGVRPQFVDYRQPGSADSARGYAPGGPGIKGKAIDLAYTLYRHGEAKRRGVLFEEFIQRNLGMSPETYWSNDELGAAGTWAQNDLFCVGSDQVWNLNYNADNRPYYLDFAPVGAKKFSLSSSIGMGRLPKLEEDNLRTSLSTFAGISVREHDAADYLQSLGLDAQHHLDPTLGLDAGIWRDVGGRGNGEDYVLVYQLNRNPDLERASDLISEHMGIRIIRVEYWTNFRGRSAEKNIRPAVEEFIALFRDAACVVTDSFHGTAFSVTFERPFVALMPPRYGSRIRSLLQLIDLEHRVASSPDQALDMVRNEPLPRLRADRLEKERAGLKNYISGMVRAG